MRLPKILRTLPLVALLGLAACPQMTAIPGGGVGAPLGASGEDAKSSKSDDEATAPEATAPLPVPSAGEGGGAGALPSAPEMAARRIGGDAADRETISAPTTVARDSAGGVVSSPVIREAIETPDDNLLIVYFPQAPRKWTNAEEFLSHVSEAQAAAAKERHLVVVLCEPCTPDEITYNREQDIAKGPLVSEPGYYLFFFTIDGMIDMGPGRPDEWFAVGSTDRLRELVLDGRLKYVGDRTILPELHIDPSLLHQSPLPRGTIMPILRDSLLIR